MLSQLLLKQNTAAAVRSSFITSSILRSSSYFTKVLVANRGEIASRVFRTCQALNIPTVAVYCTADATAQFVQDADEAICIGPPDNSYMNVDAILAAIRQSGATAVHPGYGFLSENANFSQAVTNEAGAIFLGPSASAIRQLGDKLESKRLAAQVGVSIVPGHDTPVASLFDALAICGPEIPYPVLVKAASGGGGKGMRICYNPDDLTRAWEVAKAEASKFFSDDRLLIEKYIENPHHIEFQILADSYGNVAVFPERECSIQRRNQKIIEESPSVLLSDEIRHAMAEQCRALCRAVGYESAGTVEFLVDNDGKHFYFLEMNTRLQVEHPVTESVTGVDLVEGMFQVGAGRVVPFPTEGIVPYHGHGIEVRVYAEDPTRTFLPSTGPLTRYQEPPSSLVRVDSGVLHGQNITSFFDPMISKVIAHGDTRNQAIDKMVQALDQYVIDGVRHNVRLIQSVLREPAFRAGDTPTSFLPQHYPDGFTKVKLTELETHELAAAAALILREREDFVDTVVEDGEEMIVRLGGQFGEAFGVTFHHHHPPPHHGAEDATATGTTTTVRRMDNTSEPMTLKSVDLVTVPYNGSPLVTVQVNGVERYVQVLQSTKTGELEIQMFGHDTSVMWQSSREFELSNSYMKKLVPRDTSNLVLSPMPGLLIRYAVHEGDKVVEGQELCIVESMKMQNMIRSPRAGTIASCQAAVGESLRVDQVLITFQTESLVPPK